MLRINMRIIALALVAILALNGCGRELQPRLSGGSKYNDETLSHNKVNWALVGFNVHTGNYTEVVR